jgi:cyanate lyase
MDTMVRRMTLRQLLKRHGIASYRELHQRIGGSRQHAWNLWYGYTGVGKGTARRLQEQLGIPYDELMRIVPVPRSKRIRKRPPEGGTEA